MTIDLASVELKINFSASGIEDILQQAKILFTTPVGTVPFDRDFGIDWGILDLPINQAKAAVTIEYIEKVRKYIPSVSVKTVSFTANEQGKLIPKVVLGSAA